MAEKRRINPWLIGLTVLVVVGFVLLLLARTKPSYTPITTIPAYREDSEPQDGDTQADTIKALQAYAKAAVDKAERLHDYTKSQADQVTKNSGQVDQLTQANREVVRKLQTATESQQQLQQELTHLKQTLIALEQEQSRQQPQNPNHPKGGIELPPGLGFDEIIEKDAPQQGQWYNPIDSPMEADENNQTAGFPGLLPQSDRLQQTLNNRQIAVPTAEEKNTLSPAYTIPKDAILTDAVALTALVGRIPVDGETPDPYPIKILVGRENLLANQHQLPDIEGMLLSGLGVGDANLSCVSARLYSASFIFADGRIVNQTSSDKPLAYISDPSGFPCVNGKFITNAPQFIAKRIGLAGLGSAGTAYAQAQQETQTSSLTGTTSRSLVGSIDKLVAGQAVQSATDEVSQWLLERQKQSFDAVVVKPGAAVAVHIEKAIFIDKDSQGRKIQYVNANDAYLQQMD